MIVHKVKVYPSKIHLPKKSQLAWKIAEIASDNANLNKDAIEMAGLQLEEFFSEEEMEVPAEAHDEAEAINTELDRIKTLANLS